MLRHVARRCAGIATSTTCSSSSSVAAVSLIPGARGFAVDIPQQEVPRESPILRPQSSMYLYTSYLAFIISSYLIILSHMIPTSIMGVAIGNGHRHPPAGSVLVPPCNPLPRLAPRCSPLPSRKK